VNRDVYFALIVIGLIPVIAAVLIGGTFGSGATLSLLMVAGGIAGLVAELRPRVPRARIVDRR
jgi:hypothetical protein